MVYAPGRVYRKHYSRAPLILATVVGAILMMGSVYLSLRAVDPDVESAEEQPQSGGIAAVAAIDDNAVLVTRSFSPADDDGTPPSWDDGPWTVGRFEHGSREPLWELQIPGPFSADRFAAIGSEAFAFATNTPESGVVRVYDLKTGTERWRARLSGINPDSPGTLVGTPTRLLAFENTEVFVFDWADPKPLYRGPAPLLNDGMGLSNDYQWLEVGGDSRGVLALGTGRVTPLPASVEGIGCIHKGVWYSADNSDGLLRVDLASGQAANIETEAVRAALRTQRARVSCGWFQEPGLPLRLVFGDLRHPISIDIDPTKTTPHATVAWEFDPGVRTTRFAAGRTDTTDDKLGVLWAGKLSRFVPIQIRYDASNDPDYESSIGDDSFGMFDIKNGTMTEGARGDHFFEVRMFRSGLTIFALLQQGVDSKTHLVSIDGTTGLVRGVVAQDRLTASARATTPSVVWAWSGFDRESIAGELPLVRLEHALTVGESPSGFAVETMPRFTNGLFGPAE